MKLEKYVDKNEKRRKIILISIIVIVLTSVSLVLYKTFASFMENAQFPMMKGKVDYFGNSDVYFGYYNGEEKLDEMPQKDNQENLVFDHGVCDNGAIVDWDDNEWAPLVKNLSKSKTKCSIFFKEQRYIKIGEIDIPIVERKDGLYEVTHEVSKIDSEWNKSEYRYAGVNPNNYVTFNNEIWRIIGLVNVKTTSGIEQRLKIIRQDGVKDQKDFGSYAWDRDSASSYSNNWTTSKLKDMLNGIYYESKSGDCYIGKNMETPGMSTCDFTSKTELPKGLDETARNMIDKEVIWNLGGTDGYSSVSNGLVYHFYEHERGVKTAENYPAEWTKENDEVYHNGIAIMYPSDYGYASNGGNMGRVECFKKILRDWNVGNYQNECAGTDWLKPFSGEMWTLSIHSNSYEYAFQVKSSGYVTYNNRVFGSRTIWPTLYLTTSTKIVDGTGNINSPFVLSIQ